MHGEMYRKRVEKLQKNHSWKVFESDEKMHVERGECWKFEARNKESKGKENRKKTESRAVTCKIADQATKK